MTDLDIHKLCSKFDIEILEEASYVLWNVWKAVHPKYSTLQACIGALAEDSGLYQALKNAHGLKKYDVVREWAVETKEMAVQGQVDQLLSEIRPAVSKLVTGELTLPTWTPSDMGNFEMAAHLTSLRIPCLNGKPSVLLHDLGSFESDPSLSTRLNNIFTPNHHTFLVNTSGSGKTRLLLEGMCRHWGFYFTSLVDSSLLGSSDVQNSIRSYIPDSPGFRTTLPRPGSPEYESALTRNRLNASRIFSQLFLARLLVFDLFVNALDQVEAGDSAVYKLRWLFLQLQPSLVHPQIYDIFDALTGTLSQATDSYINSTTKALLASIRKRCMDRPQSPPIFCVLDEAQYAATQHCNAFRSDNGSAYRPVLREIVRAWENQCAGQGVFMVVAGTGISKDVVDQAMASAIMKESKYRWCSDTGAFDAVDAQRRYIQKYLPPAFLSSASGERLMERVGYWLHGRRVCHLSSECLTDQFVRAEGPGPITISSRYKLDFHKLTKNTDMIATVHQITTHYLMRAVLPGSLGKDEKTYVEYGFARFIDAETNAVAVDEPLVLLAATHWINAHYRSSYKFFAKQIHVHEATSNGFENYIAFCLNLAFSNKQRVDEIFTFSGTPPEWARQKAELVSLHRSASSNSVEISPVRHSTISGPSLTLGANAKTTTDTSAWLDHDAHAPICFPHVSLGPDLLFVLRLADGTNIWVALQAKYSTGKSGMLSRLYLRRAMRSVTPSEFFLDKEGKPFSPTSDPDLVATTLQSLSMLPHRREDAGKYSLLRVVASFPAQTALKRCIEEDLDTQGHPIACLNMKYIKQLTKGLSPVDFLDGLEKATMSAQVVGKRTRKGSGLRPAPMKSMSTFNVTAARAQFPSLESGFIFGDNAGGSQVTQGVVDRISDYLINTNAQLGADYSVSAESTRRAMAQAPAEAAKMFNASSPDEIVLSHSSTMNLENVARGLEADIRVGDEFIITGEHEANAGPWKQLAKRRGAVIKIWNATPTNPSNPYSLSLKVTDLLPLITSKTRVVAFTACSNILGSIVPVKDVVTALRAQAKVKGTPKIEVSVDCVAYAPHRFIDVQDWDVDFAVFSFYKVYGPHLSALYVRCATLQASLSPLVHHFLDYSHTSYKLQPGGPSYELAYGTTAAVAYLESLTPSGDVRDAFEAIALHEQTLVKPLLGFLTADKQRERGVRVVGEEHAGLSRVPTISFVVVGQKPLRSRDIVAVFDKKGGIGIRYGHFYAYSRIEDLDPKVDVNDGVVRISLVHYNTVGEVDRIIEILEEVLAE
ncbi:hypothetical protein DXG03_009682 [Asterophora parasitica]|uniref:Aminotransferase class V domain-containing protein n=1 Tax=Asterophora parasitica TaxID=117018 RepID=A0A9P7G558_9AGAR|nr:hypothetical protein DXG03_009682 [Asterophora parasitica]